MMTTTYSHLREHLAEVWDEVESSREPVILQRRGHEDWALIPAAELKSLQESAHLLRSPKNAARLLAALTRAEERATDPTWIEAPRATLALTPTDWRRCMAKKPPKVGAVCSLRQAMVVDPLCHDDLRYWVREQTRIAEKIMNLMAEVIRDPLAGTGKPEPLKGLGTNVWSRRITQEQRLVYKASDDRIACLQARYHY